MKDDIHERPLADNSEADERAYWYLYGGIDESERVAFEADAAAQPELTARLAAWARARATTRYLRMRPTLEGPRPELYLSPELDGYGALELKTRAQQRRFAAGAGRKTEQEFYQTVSEDGRLLFTLRRETSRQWYLSARYAPYGRWNALGEQYVLIQTPNEPVETPQCLLCVLTQGETGQPTRRYAAWFVPDADAPDCYVARLRLPPFNNAQRLLFGVVDADALKWLTQPEREASIQACVDEEAKQRWQQG